MGFASEEGIERSATFHIIVQTCRMMKVRVLKYLETFFEKFNGGYRDFNRSAAFYDIKNQKGRLPKQEYGIRSSEIKIKNLKLSV